MHSTTKVIIGEDNPIFARGLVEVLNESPVTEVVAVANDRDRLAAAIDAVEADVVLTDLRMPPALADEGLQVARRVRRAAPDTGVVVLSQYADVSVAAALLGDDARGRGYLLKDRIGDPDVLVEAIRRVDAGGTAIDPDLVATLMARASNHGDPVSTLTPAEREVLAMVAEGLSNQGIADRLHVGVSAIEKRINTLFAKMPLGDTRDINRRVRATLLYLASRDSPA